MSDVSEVAGLTETRSVRVLLVDDHDVVRKGLQLLLESLFPFEVIDASTAQEAVTWAKDTSVELVLLDVRMPVQDGLWALAEIRKHRPDVPILMLSTYASEEFVHAAIEGGANGYVLKEASTHQLREAIETALTRRGLYLHPAVAHRMIMRQRRDDVEALSEREMAVLQQVADGCTNEEIATSLYVSEKTVKSHLSSVFRKLGVTNRTQAAAKAIREGLVKLPVAAGAAFD